MRVHPCRRGGARVAATPPDQSFDEDAAVRVDLLIAPVDDDSPAQHVVVERHFAGSDGPRDAIALELALARQLAKPRVFERRTGEYTHGPRDSALHREPGEVRGATDSIEIGARGGCAGCCHRGGISPAAVARAG